MNSSFCNLSQLKMVAGVLWLVTLCGCASLGTYNPATGRNEFIFISTSEEVSLGKEVHQKLDEEYVFSDSSALAERIRRIGRKISQQSERQDYPYQFFLIDEDQMNAFTTPGGNIYFFSGLAKKLTTDDQIASVIAHEVGHCAARHTVKKYQAALGYNLIGSIVLSQVGEGAQQAVSLGSNTVMGLISSAYSRKDEYEADRLSVRYMRLAGYDPKALIETLELLEQEAEGSQGFLFLRSHPYIPDRIEVLKQEIASSGISSGQ